MPLNAELLARRARHLATQRTAPGYRLYALAKGAPRRPGLLYAGGDTSIEVEIWSLPRDEVGSLVAAVPAPLAIGRVRLEDGSEASGFLCEAHAPDGAEDITAFGSWRRWLQRSAPAAG